jgi:hypothetical protein
MMMCTPCISRELLVFKIIIIYVFFVEFIDNEKNYRKVMWQMMMCTPTCLIIIYVIFLEIIDNKKIEESDGADDDVYILYVKRYAIRNCIGLGR